MIQTVLLGDICHYITEKISVSEVALKDYVSTENLIAEKGGLSLASNLPQTGKVTRYQAGDVLVSNIRPYFKKIWFADRTGGASNDVLVFRPTTDEVANEYLYYVLANDKFFDYSTASSGGSKMPRGDKVQIMKYPVYLPDLETQKKIAEALGRIDEKIELNRAMNETLEQMGQALFHHYFIDNPEADTWESGVLGDLVDINRESISKNYSHDEILYVDISSVSTGSIDKYESVSLDAAPSRAKRIVRDGDIIWATVRPNRRAYSLVTNPQENMIVSTGFAVLSPKKDTSGFVYYLTSSQKFTNYLVLHARGAAYPAVTATDFANAPIAIPDTETLTRFNKLVASNMRMIGELKEEIQTLTALRDTLLPRLISGKVKV